MNEFRDNSSVDENTDSTKRFSGRVTIGADWYNELLEAKIQRDMLLNIVKNVSSYNVAGYIRDVFDINLKEDE